MMHVMFPFFFFLILSFFPFIGGGGGGGGCVYVCVCGWVGGWVSTCY